MKKKVRRQPCSYEGCTKRGTHVNPYNNSTMLCEQHILVQFDKIKARANALNEVDKERIFIKQKIKGDKLMQVIQNRELSFSEKINLLNL